MAQRQLYLTYNIQLTSGGNQTWTNTYAWNSIILSLTNVTDRQKSPVFCCKKSGNPKCLSDLSQNVLDALSCRRQSFRQVWYKSAVDCIEMLTKLHPKITHSSMVKNMKKWSGIHTRATKSSSLPKGHPLSMSTKFGRRPFPRSSVILFTESQTEWQTERYVIT